MKREFDLIIFDLDGTLYVDTPSSNRAFSSGAVNVLMRKLGLDEETSRELFREKKKEMEKKIGGMPTNTLTLLHYYEDVTVEEFEAEVNRLMDVEAVIEPDPRASEAVRKVASQYRLALFTTNNGITARRILNRIGMDDFFPMERRFTLSRIGRLPFPRREQLTYLKPNPGGFGLILDETGSRPGHTLMIGDSEVSDIRPAEALGLRTYRISSRESLYELPEWLGI